MKGLAIAAVAMSETKLQSLLRVMQWSVDGLAAVRVEVFHDQVQQTVSGLENLAVVVELEARVKIAVMAQPPLDMFRTKLGFFENIGVRFEPDERAVRLRGFAFLLVLELALLEPGFHELAFPMAADQEFFGKSVNRLGADAVQADAELKHVVVVFGAGIDLGNAIDNFSQRNAPAEITHCNGF